MSRIAPHSVEVEAASIGAAVLNPDAASVVAGLGPEAWWSPAHRELAEGIRDLVNRGEPVDPVTLGELMERRGRDRSQVAEQVAELEASCPSSTRAGEYARILTDLHRMRQLIAVGQAIAELGWDRPEDVDAAIIEARRLVSEIPVDAQVVADLLEAAA